MKKGVFDSGDEDDDKGRTLGRLQLNKSEESKLNKELKKDLYAGEGMGDYNAVGGDVEDTIYTSSGCQSEQLNIAPISNVFANSFIETPQRIKNSKACVNIKNKNDNKCFLWCHLLHKRYRMSNNKKVEHPERLYGEKAFVFDKK